MDAFVKPSKNWPFYFSLEQDVLGLSRYIEFDTSNFHVHSIELLRLYLSIGSEIDVVLKQICHQLADKSAAKNIIQYREIMAPAVPEFFDEKAFCPRFNITLQPWKDWLPEKRPDWWGAYNDVKHNRSEHYQKATLGNVLASLAALYLANMYHVFVKQKQVDPQFTFSVRDVIPIAPVEQDFFRIDDLIAYDSEY